MADCWECVNVNTQMCEGCKVGYMDSIDGWVQLDKPTHFIPKEPQESEGGGRMTIFKSVEALYCGLRDKAEIERRAFNPDKYKWVLGNAVLEELKRDMWGYMSAPKSLFGMTIEIDYANPDALRLWEDITDSVSIPYEKGAEE